MKKVLSWVLVLALVLGSFSMAFAGDTDNASNMKDAAQIKNVEAVDVMVATGIIGGYPDGNYYPEKAVTRAEMAKMISVAVNGGEDIGNLYANSCTFADSKNHWAAGYIAYCAAEGIIDGRDADTFDPDATVTGTEASKMLLVALGYDSKIAGYVGTNWASNVLKDAKKNEFYEDMDNFNAGLSLNRDNAAQIIFNAMQATTVEYDYGTNVSIGDVDVSVNSKVNEVTKPASLDQNGNGTIELYEVAFDGDLEKITTNVTDDFGRPSHDWEYDDEAIGTYADEADITFVADDTFADLDAAINDYDDDYHLNNGTNSFAKLYGADYNGTDDILAGDVIELYEASKDKYDAVVLRYVADRISDVNTDVKTADAKDGVEAYVTFENSRKFNDDAIPGFDAKTYVEDAVIAVAYNAAKTKVLDSYVPEKVSGEVTKLYTGKLTLAGTSYDLIGTGLVPFDTVNAESDYDLYLINGYAAGAVLVESGSSTVYGVLLGIGNSTFATNDIAKILTADGTVQTYDIDTAGTVLVTGNKGKIVGYSINDDGTIDGEAADTNYVGNYTNGEGTAIPDMTSKGLIAGRTVVDDVVVFDYDGATGGNWVTDSVDEDYYDVLGYDALKDAEDMVGVYVYNADGDIVAVYTNSGVSASNTVLGFYVGYSNATNGSDAIYDVELLVNGESKNYDTVKTSKLSGTAIAGISQDAIVSIKLNADGEITSITDVTANNTAKADPQTDFGTYDYIQFTAAYDKLVSRSGNKLTLKDSSNVEYIINVEGAAVYKMVGGHLDADEYTLSDLEAGDTVTVYQFSEDSDTWDVVIFQ